MDRIRAGRLKAIDNAHPIGIVPRHPTLLVHGDRIDGLDKLSLIGKFRQVG
jgi:hypothetical protein